MREEVIKIINNIILEHKNQVVSIFKSELVDSGRMTPSEAFTILNGKNASALNDIVLWIIYSCLEKYFSIPISSHYFTGE